MLKTYVDEDRNQNKIKKIVLWFSVASDIWGLKANKEGEPPNRSFTFPTQKSRNLCREFKVRSEDKIRRLESDQKEETKIKIHTQK